MRSGWLLLMLAACYAPSAPQGAPCASSGECPTGQLCRAGVCSTEALPLDGAIDGPLDAIDDAPVDAPLVDAAPDAPAAVDPWQGIPGLVARFPMDDDPMVSRRITSNLPQYEGTCVVPACPTAIVGVVGGGYRFDGAQRAELAGSLVGVTPYTVAVWAYVDPIDRPYRLAVAKPSALDYNANVFGFGLNAGMIAFESTNGNYQTLYANGVTGVDEWSHYALTWDGARKRIFINGVQIAAQTSALIDSSLPLSLGSDFDFGAASGFWQGRLDELRIYDRALDTTEIAQLATSSGP